MLDAASMREVTGTAYYASVLFSPGTPIIQLAMFVRSVAQGLRANRVSLHEMSPVTALTKRGADWVATTPKRAGDGASGYSGGQRLSGELWLFPKAIDACVYDPCLDARGMRAFGDAC